MIKAFTHAYVIGTVLLPKDPTKDEVSYIYGKINDYEYRFAYECITESGEEVEYYKHEMLDRFKNPEQVLSAEELQKKTGIFIKQTAL